MIFRQLFEPVSSTYTYIVADPVSKQGLVIDSVRETFERDLLFVNQLELDLKYVFDTHVHADHVTAASEFRAQTKAQTGVSEHSGVDCADIYLKDGQSYFLGKLEIKVLATPGHTNSCMSFYIQDRVFTGDTLLIRGCGRTDFQQGSSEKLFKSVREKLFTLPDETLVFPAHNYQGVMCSSIAEEKKYNPRLGLDKTKGEFVQIMSELKLANPKMMDVAVPLNLQCGKAS